MEILHLTATQFLKPMGSGRTRPVLLGAETADEKVVEVVVKLRGRELSERAQIAELVAAPLAECLGLSVPPAAVVEVSPDFDAIVPIAYAEAVRSSPGPNFGSVHLGTSFTTWAPGRGLVGVQRDQAASIFAFDLLVQNPDRRAANPNLWTRTDHLGVYDHEQAFSFLHLPVIGGCPRPWRIGDQPTGFRFMENHVFYGALRGGRLDLGPFETKLEALSNAIIKGLLKPVPAEWKQGNELCEGIDLYLREARLESRAFMNFVKHLLR